MKNVEDVLKTFEWNEIPPGSEFFDSLEKRFFINFLDCPIKVGFGHNGRRVELIAIGEGIKKDPELEALQGKEIVEE